MKGVILDCLANLVKERFGSEPWERVLAGVGMDPHRIFFATEDVPDRSVHKLMAQACAVLALTPEQAADAFGDYWVNVYACKVYRHYFAACKTAKDFLFNMDNVHQAVTRKMPNARPPRFIYERKGERHLVLTYQSERGMLDLLLGLVKGVGKYYGERLEVTRLNERQVQVTFAE